jgi:hypothetical protein
VVDQEDITRLQRLIFRSTKGKSYLFKQEFDDELYEASEKRVSKSVYIIVYWEGAHIKNKIERICDSF